MARINHGEILVSPADIQAGIKRVAEELYEENKDRDPVYVGMLTGGFIFTTLVVLEMVKIEPLLNPEVDFMRIGSYGMNTKPGEPRILGDLSETTQIRGRHVTLLDDMGDTRKTMRLGRQHMMSLGASSTSVAVLASRPSDSANIEDGIPAPDHVAVVLPSDEFVLGMGLNGPKGGRVMPYIARYIQPSGEEI